jgi:hypothetical protein
LKTRNPKKDKSLPKKPDEWENDRATASRRAKFGAWKRYKIEPTTLDLLKRQMEAEKVFQKEWWYAPSHIFLDYPVESVEFFKEKIRFMVKSFFETKEWLWNEYRKHNWGPALDRIRNCMTEIYQTDLKDYGKGKEMIGEFVAMAAACAIKGLNNKLIQKIIQSGLDKGIDTDDFLVVRLCFYAITKNWNYYSQITAEIKFRMVQNLDWQRYINYGDIYLKAL